MKKELPIKKSVRQLKALILVGGEGMPWVEVYAERGVNVFEFSWNDCCSGELNANNNYKEEYQTNFHQDVTDFLKKKNVPQVFKAVIDKHYKYLKNNEDASSERKFPDTDSKYLVKESSMIKYHLLPEEPLLKAAILIEQNHADDSRKTPWMEVYNSGVDAVYIDLDSIENMNNVEKFQVAKKVKKLPKKLLKHFLKDERLVQILLSKEALSL